MSDEDIGEVAEETSEEASEIGQISLYLIKDKVTFDGAIDPEANIKSKNAFKLLDFTVGDASCRFIYFQSVADRSNPSWLEFINERLPKADRVAFSATSTNPNGILLVRLDNKTFAATFGRSAVGCLLRSAIVQDFGIRTAMNMCGNEEVRQTKTLSNAITTTYIDRQVSTPSDSFVFGINEAEDLRYISAHMIGNKNITLQGKESLTIKVIGTEKLSWLGLISKCREFIKKYDDTSYAKLFPNYRNFRPAPDDISNDLDAKLVAELKAKNFTKFQFSIPDFIQDDKYSFSYTNNKSRNNKIYSHIDISQLDAHVKFDNDLTVAKLKARYIFAYSHEDDKILSHPKWSSYDCLVFESDHPNGGYYLLRAGEWVEVDKGFHKTISNFIKKKVRVEPCESAFKGIDISDDAAKKNLEGKFNSEVVVRKPAAILFDRAKLQIGAGRKDKEFCDILDMADDGSVRIIHCKPHKDASSINYLFSQAKFYCDAFLRDDVFLREIREFINGSTCTHKAAYLSYIKDNIDEIRGNDYVVCLWLLYNEKEKCPKKEDIPLISQFELKLMHDHLRRHCKFKDVILRFVPVKVKTYTSSKKPSATT